MFPATKSLTDIIKILIKIQLSQTIKNEVKISLNHFFDN